MDILQFLQSQAGQVEVVNVQQETAKLEFEANKLKTSKIEETRGLAVRLVKEGRLGFAASSDMQALDKLAANALESATYGDPVPLCFPEARPAPAVKAYDPKIVELHIARLTEIGQEIIDLVVSAEPQALLKIGVRRAVERISICNQTGAEVTFARSPLSISVEASRIEGDDVLILEEISGVTAWETDYLAIAHRLVEKFEQSRHLATIQSGRMPVIFSPSGALALSLPLMAGVDGKNVYTGVSPMAGKTGEKLFDEKISLIDDATLDGRFNSAPYDDEGVPHRRNTLIESGVIKGFLYDLKTAAQSGVESTGNGSRGLFDPPVPAPTHLILEPGETPLAEMIASLDHGLLVDEVLGLGQGNIISGAFSNPVVLAFKIENGQLAGRVKDVSIADNIYSLLRNVEAVSREQQWVYGSFCLPNILLAEMNVVTKE